MPRAAQPLRVSRIGKEWGQCLADFCPQLLQSPSQGVSLESSTPWPFEPHGLSTDLFMECSCNRNGSSIRCATVGEHWAKTPGCSPFYCVRVGVIAFDITFEQRGTTMLDYSEEHRKRIAWENATAVAGSPLCRIDCDGRTICWTEYGKYTDFGWHIDHKLPKSLGGSDLAHNLRARHWRGNCLAGALLGGGLFGLGSQR